MQSRRTDGRRSNPVHPMRFTAPPSSAIDVAHGGRKMLWVSRNVYDTVWTLAKAQRLSMREAADDLICGKVGRLRSQLLDVLDPGWRRRQPLAVHEEQRVLMRAASILRRSGKGLLADVVEASGVSPHDRAEQIRGAPSDA